MPHIPADTPESLLEAVKRKIEKIAGITVTHASGKLKWLRVHTEAKSTRAVRKLVELAERTNGVVTVYTNGPNGQTKQRGVCTVTNPENPPRPKHIHRKRIMYFPQPPEGYRLIEDPEEKLELGDMCLTDHSWHRIGTASCFGQTAQQNQNNYPHVQGWATQRSPTEHDPNQPPKGFQLLEQDTDIVQIEDLCFQTHSMFSGTPCWYRVGGSGNVHNVFGMTLEQAKKAYPKVQAWARPYQKFTEEPILTTEILEKLFQ